MKLFLESTKERKDVYRVRTDTGESLGTWTRLKGTIGGPRAMVFAPSGTGKKFAAEDDSKSVPPRLAITDEAGNPIGALFHVVSSKGRFIELHDPTDRMIFGGRVKGISWDLFSKDGDQKARFSCSLKGWFMSLFGEGGPLSVELEKPMADGRDLKLILSAMIFYQMRYLTNKG